MYQIRNTGSLKNNEAKQLGATVGNWMVTISVAEPVCRSGSNLDKTEEILNDILAVRSNID